MVTGARIKGMFVTMTDGTVWAFSLHATKSMEDSNKMSTHEEFAEAVAITLGRTLLRWELVEEE